MEFYSQAMVRIPAADLQRFINIQNLPEWCASIDRVLSVKDEYGDIYCVWGEFRIHRELIQDGVRFTLPGCPNALQWTITPDPQDSTRIQVHCTINRAGHDPDFIESLQAFVDDWRNGLEHWPQRRVAKRNKPCGQCSDSFGGFG